MSVAKSVQADADDRDHRAATEAMVVVPNGPGLYEVHSGEQSTYTVDIVSGASSYQLEIPGRSLQTRVAGRNGNRLAVGGRQLGEFVWCGLNERILGLEGQRRRVYDLHGGPAIRRVMRDPWLGSLNRLLRG